jgi:phosphoribosyl 1,2-cyclic phosphodiesterase
LLRRFSNGLEDQDSILGRRNFSLHHSVQTGYGAYRVNKGTDEEFFEEQSDKGLKLLVPWSRKM